MAHDLTTTPAATGVITVPDDGDDLVAASVEVPLQQLGDWVRWVYDRAANITPFGNITASGLITANSGVFVGLATNTLSVPTSATIAAATIGATSFTSTVAVAGVLTTATNVIVGGTLGVNGIGGISVNAGPLSVNKTISAVKGYLARILSGPDADATIIGSDYDVVIAVLTGTRTYTVSTLDATAGHTIYFHNDTPAAINLNISAGADSSVVAPGEVAWYVFTSGVWKLIKKW